MASSGGNRGARRFVRWSIVGGAGFVLQLGVLVWCWRVLGMPQQAATAVAVSIAILHNFVWHERWTWAGDTVTDDRWPWRFARFAGLTALTSLIGTVAVTAILVSFLELPLPVANAFAVLMLSVINFAAIPRVVLCLREKGDGGRA